MEHTLRVIKQALLAVYSLRLRTFFSVLSVALSVSAITLIVAVVEGAYKRAIDMVERFGPDSVLIFGGEQQQRALDIRQKTLTLEDLEAIKSAFPTAYLAIPQSSERGINVSYKNKKYSTLVVGSTEHYSEAWSWPVLEGSDFKEEDVKGLRNVALIGSYLQRELFGTEDSIGKYILVKGIPIRIVGVLGERGTSPGGNNLDDRIILPISTLMRKMQNETRYISAIRLRFTDKENLDARVEELRELLRVRHRIPKGRPDDFRIISPKEIIKFLVALTGSLVLFLGVVGLTSLVVSGFVLANLFLLSVRERAQEIGIRRAVGAKKNLILFQFLSESVAITTIGGLLGFALGILSSRLLTLVAEFPIYFSWRAFAVGFSLSLFVGLVFGLEPARKASALNPIEAIKG